jgi:hypothetical protein
MEYNTYLSDDEVDIENQENEEFRELDQYGMPIEEVCEENELEIRRIISNKMLSKNSLNEDIFYNNNDELSKKSSFKQPKNIKNKNMSLNDLNNLINKKIEEKKPKKFISKRSIEKKSLTPLLSTDYLKESKRQFNPRKVPYLFSDEYKNKKMCDEKNVISLDNLEFPSL